MNLTRQDIEFVNDTLGNYEEILRNACVIVKQAEAIHERLCTDRTCGVHEASAKQLAGLIAKQERVVLVRAKLIQFRDGLDAEKFLSDVMKEI